MVSGDAPAAAVGVTGATAGQPERGAGEHLAVLSLLGAVFSEFWYCV